MLVEAYKEGVYIGTGDIEDAAIMSGLSVEDIKKRLNVHIRSKWEFKSVKSERIDESLYNSPWGRKWCAEWEKARKKLLRKSI
jgi:hypothetical protein